MKKNLAPYPLKSAMWERVLRNRFLIGWQELGPIGVGKVVILAQNLALKLITTKCASC